MNELVEHGRLVRVGALDDLKQTGCMAITGRGYDVAVFYASGQVYAVDNRCPHMGFPLTKGSVKDGILTCHWHHARFDLASGGTFDQFADDVRSFPVVMRDGEVWVDVTPRADMRAHQRQRLQDGLERNIPLVVAKAVNALVEDVGSAVEPFCIGLDFGTHYRQAGWGMGLTILTCMMNMLPTLSADDRPRALYHGLSAVARDCDSAPPHFALHPLPGDIADMPTLKRWFRRFVEVRDAEGAERCIVSALYAGTNPQQIADMLFAAVTDHRYIQIGHPLDFTNKALEALDIAGWGKERAQAVLASLAMGYANADRMEESNAWRNPIDLIAILEDAFEQIAGALESGRNRRGTWAGRDALIAIVMAEDPHATVAALLEALRAGATEEQLAGAVAGAASLRIARFHTSNEFGDWDTALHTFTFANAVQQGLRRVPSVDLLRGVFDATMSIYLDRFLNVPPARLPDPKNADGKPEEILAEMPVMLNRQQQVDEAAAMVARYLAAGGNPDDLLALLGKLLLREDRDFHTIQTMEAAFRQVAQLRGTPSAVTMLVAAARYLAAHSPTVRAQGQTYQIAYRLGRGEHLFEE